MICELPSSGYTKKTSLNKYEFSNYSTLCSIFIFRVQIFVFLLKNLKVGMENQIFKGRKCWEGECPLHNDINTCRFPDAQIRQVKMVCQGHTALGSRDHFSVFHIPISLPEVPPLCRGIYRKCPLFWLYS